MTVHQIAEVPERIWLGTKKPARQWKAQYNVAGWINVMSGEGTYTLAVTYKDARGLQQVVVDSGYSSGSGALLLSNRVTLEFQGKASTMAVVLKTPNAAARFSVDELYLQDAMEKQGTQRKLVSAY